MALEPLKEGVDIISQSSDRTIIYTVGVVIALLGAYLTRFFYREMRAMISKDIKRLESELALKDEVIKDKNREIEELRERGCSNAR